MVEASEPLPLSPPLLGCHLDLPARGPVEGELVLAGWALCAEGPIARVLATVGAARPLHVPADRGRADIAAAFPDLAHAERSGFRLRIAAAMLTRAEEIVLAAELPGGARVPIWRIALATPTVMGTETATARTPRERSPYPRRRSRLGWGRRRGDAPASSSPPPPVPGAPAVHELGTLSTHEPGTTTAQALGASTVPLGASTVHASALHSTPAPPASHPRVVAIISAFNEADIIEPVLGHLAANGICSYLIDNDSTDETVSRASRWLGQGLLGVERFANQPDGRMSWKALLARKLELARELGADWYIHHDADEIRESPWPGVSLREAIGWVDRLGFNAIDFRVFNFPPVDDTFGPGADPRSHFTRWEDPAEYDRIQHKCWKADLGCEVELAQGGHEVRFAKRRVFPLRFLLCHYPIRGQGHGTRKVLRERKGRFAAEETALGWHRQYDHVRDPSHMFLRNPASLRHFDLEQLRLETMLADGRAAPAHDNLLPGNPASAIPVPNSPISSSRVADSPVPDSPLPSSSLPDSSLLNGPADGSTAGGELEAPRAQGFLELVSPTKISGWAALVDGNAREAASVELWDGGRMFATVTADEPRQDLAEQGIGGGRAGFSVRTPRELLDGRPHWIWATVAGTGIALRRSPLVLHVPGRISLARANEPAGAAGAR